jgi:phosphopantetheinyl transferase (holo-ACP synthase)
MIEDTIELNTISVISECKKPKISYEGTEYHCSISHSNEYVACSIDKLNQNGIDVEELKPRSIELQNYIVGHNEMSYFDIGEQFITTRVWSIKEATFKADINQTLITNYIICNRDNDSFLVQNLQTKKSVTVKNYLIDNYTVSYTIPIQYE